MNYDINMYAALRALCPPRSPQFSRGVPDTCYPLPIAWRPADPTLSLVPEEDEESLELYSLNSSSDGFPRDLSCKLGAEPFVKSAIEMFALRIISSSSSFEGTEFLQRADVPKTADITLTSSSLSLLHSTASGLPFLPT